MSATTTPLAERDRLVEELAACGEAIRRLNGELNDTLGDIKLSETELGAAYQRAARNIDGEAPEEVEARAEIARARYNRAERAVEEAHRAERTVQGELQELYKSERELFIEEAMKLSAAFQKWAAKSAKSVKAEMVAGGKLEATALHRWMPLSTALGVQPPTRTEVIVISNAADKLAVDDIRPADIEVEGEAAPAPTLPPHGTTVWIVRTNNQHDQVDVGSPAWDRAVEEGAEICDPPPGAE